MLCADFFCVGFVFGARDVDADNLCSAFAVGGDLVGEGLADFAKSLGENFLSGGGIDGGAG